MFWIYLVAIGAFFVALSIAIGAFAAHALKSSLDSYGLGLVELSAKYLMYQGLGTMLMGLVMTRIDTFLVRFAVIIAPAGVLVFSATLLALALTQMKWFGAITPIGGSMMILAWIAFAVGIIAS